MYLFRICISGFGTHFGIHFEIRGAKFKAFKLRSNFWIDWISKWISRSTLDFRALLISRAFLRKRPQESGKLRRKKGRGKDSEENSRVRVRVRVNYFWVQLTKFHYKSERKLALGPRVYLIGRFFYPKLALGTEFFWKSLIEQ